MWRQKVKNGRGSCFKVGSRAHFVCTYTFYEKDKVKQRAEDNRETSLSINEWRFSH